MSLPTDPGYVPVMKDETRQKLGLITPDELAETLKITVTTLQSWRCDGQGPEYIKLGKQVFYRLTDVKDWIASHPSESKDGSQEHVQSA